MYKLLHPCNTWFKVKENTEKENKRWLLVFCSMSSFLIGPFILPITNNFCNTQFKIIIFNLYINDNIKKLI